MNKLIALLGALAVLGTALAYPTGAPATVCDDMYPRHGVDPQTSEIPYLLALSSDKVEANQEVELVISGDEPFKGFLIEVRDGDQAVGQFEIPDSDEDSQTLDCHDGIDTAATHKNADYKNNVVLKWKAPETSGTLTVYLTIVREFKTFWAKQVVGTITVV